MPRKTKRGMMIGGYVPERWFNLVDAYRAKKQAETPLKHVSRVMAMVELLSIGLASVGMLPSGEQAGSVAEEDES